MKNRNVKCQEWVLHKKNIGFCSLIKNRGENVPMSHFVPTLQDNLNLFLKSFRLSVMVGFDQSNQRLKEPALI